LVGVGVVKQNNANQVVSIISSLGVPLLVACDVAKPPSFVRSIAAKFNVKVYSPSRNMSQESKHLMAKEILNHHIRDAYAAALKAYRKYSNRFRHINKKYPEKAEEYKRMVLEGLPVGKYD
jgi:predicted RNase H-like nuclease (RuvC/YqgF family)